MTGGGEGFGLGLGQVQQLPLDGVDLPCRVGRVDALDSGGHFRKLVSVNYSRFLQALPRGLGLVLDAFAAAVGAGGVADGPFRRGEKVQAQRHQLPQLVEKLPAPGRCRSASRTRVCVLRGCFRLHIGWSLFWYGRELLDIAGLQPSGDLVADELRPALRVEGHHGEREPLL